MWPAFCILILQKMRKRICIEAAEQREQELQEPLFAWLT
jgi:hypothetical protein